jgi:hypothetical protein
LSSSPPVKHSVTGLVGQFDAVAALRRRMATPHWRDRRYNLNRAQYGYRESAPGV